MKIAVLSTGVFVCPPTGYSGLEMLAWLQAKGLAAKGHRVTLFAPDGSSCPGCDIVHIGPAGQWDEATSYSKYWQHLLHQEVILDNTWNKWSFQLKAEGRITYPILAVCHAPVNTMFSTWPPQFPNLPPVQKACPVCISEDQRSHFEALFNTPARTVYNGIDLGYYKSTGTIRTDRFLFLARFSTIKGPLLAIESCKEAGASLDLVGDSSITNEPEYLEQCKRACDGKQIRMVGASSRGGTVNWYSQAHCMIHPVRNFREPFGLAPIESMACGTPVIAWRNGAMKETIVEGETGWLVNNEQELVAAIRLARESDPLGISPYIRKRCREQASLFSVERMVSRYHDLCEEAVQTGGW